MISNNIILLNMFVLILLDIFEKFYKNPNDPIFIFNDNLLHFKISYSQYLYEKSIEKITINKILDFLKYLKPPLG